MSTREPRVAVTLPVGIKNIYKNTADVMGISMSKLIAQMLTQAAPSVAELGSIVTDAESPIHALNGLSELSGTVNDEIQGEIFDVIDSEFQKSK